MHVWKVLKRIQWFFPCSTKWAINMRAESQNTKETQGYLQLLPIQPLLLPFSSFPPLPQILLCLLLFLVHSPVNLRPTLTTWVASGKPLYNLILKLGSGYLIPAIPKNLVWWTCTKAILDIVPILLMYISRWYLVPVFA